MRIYYHPSVGDYAKHDSFEADYAVLAGAPSAIITGVAGWAFKKSDTVSLLASLAGGSLMAGAFGAYYPKKILSWFNPSPLDAPIRYPRQIPKVVVPSFIGESGQVLNLLMHHGAGDTLRDYSGFNNHGKIYGAGWIDGSYGWALNFDGATSNAQVPNSTSLKLATMTIECWINTAEIPFTGGAGIIARTSNGYSTTLNYLLQGIGNVVQFTVSDGTTTKSISSGALQPDLWYHVVVTYDLINLRLYINNVSVVPVPSVVVPIQGAYILHIGHRPNYQYFEGSIGGIRVYNRVLSDTERTYHFESTRSIFGV